MKSLNKSLSFWHLWLPNVLAPQLCALFRHLDVQKWSEHVVFLPCWLGNVLRAKRRAIFYLSSGQLASHPLLWQACFSNRRSQKTLEKHIVSRLSYPFVHLHLLSSDSLLALFWFSLTFSGLLFSSLLFSSLLFSGFLFWRSSLLFICPYRRKFDF